jgi:hypothetical protein
MENCALKPGSPGYQAVKDAVRNGLPIRNLHTGPLADRDIDYFLRAIEEAAKESHLSDEQIRAQRHTPSITATTIPGATKSRSLRSPAS